MREVEALPALPLEPLYRLEVAAELVPFGTLAGLYMFLSRHKEEFPGRYMQTYGGRQVRMLYASEIRKIREMRLLEAGEDRYHTEAFKTQWNRPRFPRTPIGEIMRRAMVHA